MAACGSSFQHTSIFEGSSLPETHHHSSLIDSLSSSSSSSSSSSCWNQQQQQQPLLIKPVSPSPVVGHHSFTDLFGDLHFKENPQPQVLSPTHISSPVIHPNKSIRSSPSSGDDSFCSTKYDSRLQLCTEGLGFESLVDDVKDQKKDTTTSCTTNSEKIMMNHDSVVPSPHQKPTLNSTTAAGNSSTQYSVSRNCGGRFPPPISCIGRSTGMSFKSYRQDGRLVLQQVRLPTQEFLHASRKNGRLRLRFVQPDDDNDLTAEEDSFQEDKCEQVLAEDEGKESTHVRVS